MSQLSGKGSSKNCDINFDMAQRKRDRSLEFNNISEDVTKLIQYPLKMWVCQSYLKSSLTLTKILASTFRITIVPGKLCLLYGWNKRNTPTQPVFKIHYTLEKLENF